ncbi:glycosyltransferase [Bosea sp. (in: a-proteobacteria)]|uniref:glycosyltransferase n=1 Tax=Bosea sp. (in: a-proteobacteria) TaxID=1871050 RepID=UPI003B3B3FD3
MTDRSRPPRILHVAETVRGGIATYLNELHRHHAVALGEENLAYVIPQDHKRDLDAVPDASITTFVRKGRDVSSMSGMAVSTCRAIRRFRPDVVHLHSTFSGILRPMLKLLFPRLAVVYCPHGWAFLRESSTASRVVTRTMERLLAPLADRIVCISDCERRAALEAGIADRRLALIYNGMSNERPDYPAAEWSDERLKVLFIGRLDRQKGYDILLEAAADLQTEVHLRMIGSTVVGREQALEHPANVEMLGWQSPQIIEAQLDAADLVVIPSRWEGFGLVALEAMRARRPIVAFAVGALPEIVEDGVTGILCSPPGAEALVAGLKRALDMPLRPMGEAGFQRFRRLFLVDTMQIKLQELYRETSPAHEPASHSAANVSADARNPARNAAR